MKNLKKFLALALIMCAAQSQAEVPLYVQRFEYNTIPSCSGEGEISVSLFAAGGNGGPYTYTISRGDDFTATVPSVEYPSFPLVLPSGSPFFDYAVTDGQNNVYVGSGIFAQLPGSKIMSFKIAVIPGCTGFEGAVYVQSVGIDGEDETTTTVTINDPGLSRSFNFPGTSFETYISLPTSTLYSLGFTNSGCSYAIGAFGFVSPEVTDCPPTQPIQITNVSVTPEVTDAASSGCAAPNTTVTVVFSQPVIITAFAPAPPSSGLPSFGTLTFGSSAEIIMPSAPSGGGLSSLFGGVAQFIQSLFSANGTDARSALDGLPSASVTVNLDSQPFTSVTYTAKPACNGVANGSLKVDVAGATASAYTLTLPNGAELKCAVGGSCNCTGDCMGATCECTGTSATFSGLPAGTYQQLAIESSTPCPSGPPSTTLTNITLNNFATTDITFDATALPCAMSNSGIIQVSNVVGGITPYKAVCANDTFCTQFLPGENQAQITGLPSGTYTVVVTDANGCTGSVPGVVVSCIEPIDFNVKVQTAHCGHNKPDHNQHHHHRDRHRPKKTHHHAHGMVKVENITGGVPPYTYAVRDASNFKSVDRPYKCVRRGSYTVTVKDSVGTIATKPVTVDIVS